MTQNEVLSKLLTRAEENQRISDENVALRAALDREKAEKAELQSGSDLLSRQLMRSCESVNALRAELAAVLEALEPFSRLLDTDGSGYESSADDEIVRSIGTLGRDYQFITVGDLRTARAALQSHRNDKPLQAPESDLRKIIDLTWGYVMEDGSVPSTKIQDKILSSLQSHRRTEEAPTADEPEHDSLITREQRHRDEQEERLRRKYPGDRRTEEEM